MMLRILFPRLFLGFAIVVGASWLTLHRGQVDPAFIENAIRALGPWGPAAHVALFTNYALGLTRIPVVSCMLTLLICGMATNLWTGVTGTVG